MPYLRSSGAASSKLRLSHRDCASILLETAVAGAQRDGFEQGRDGFGERPAKPRRVGFHLVQFRAFRQRGQAAQRIERFGGRRERLRV